MAASSGGQDDFPPLDGATGGNPNNTNTGGDPNKKHEDNLNNKKHEDNLNNKKNEQSFSAAAGTKATTQWLVLRLFREDKSIQYNLSRKEKADLVYKRLKLPPSKVKSIVSSNFEHIRIELTSDVNVEDYKKAEAIYIRPGLKVQPMKELKRTTRVKICWVDLDIDNSKRKDDAIIETLSLFGKIEGDIEHLMYELTEAEMADDTMYNLRNVRSGERAVEIEIHIPIPSFIKVDGKRARVWHPGQNYTCGRCYRSFRNCPGKADRAECKRLKGTERDFEDFWKEVAVKKPHKEAMGPEEEYTTDIIDIARVPVEATKDELLEFLRKEEVDVAPENLIATQFAETWRILDIPSSEVMKAIVKRCHGRRFQGRNLLFLPVQLPTPMKKRTSVPTAPPTDAATEVPAPAAADNAPKPPTAEELKAATDREKAKIDLEKVRKYNEEVIKKAERREALEKKRRQEEFEKEKERLRMQGVEAERAGRDGSSGRSGASERTGGPAVAGGEGVEAQVSPNKVNSNTAMNVLNTVKNIFGMKSSVPPEAEIYKSNVVQETPTAAKASEKTPNFLKKGPSFVIETPAVAVDVTSASPELTDSMRDREENGNSSVNTIDSQDEIFGTTNLEVDLQPFRSEFAKEIERRHSFSKEAAERPRPQRTAIRRSVVTEFRPRVNSLGLAEKRERIQVGSQSSGDGSPEPEKEKKGGEKALEKEEELGKTPGDPGFIPFGMVLTKNQKKKLKKREAKKLREGEDATSPTK